MSAMETCSLCGGRGVVGVGGWPEDCPRCDGFGLVTARDERGRFVSLPRFSAATESEPT